MTQKMKEKFSTFEIEHAPRNENRFADVLAVLGSQIMFEGDNNRVMVSKREESIIEVLKERFLKEQCEGDWRIPIKKALMKRRRRRRTEVVKGLRHDERRIIPQNSWWGLIQMCRARRSLEKVERST